VWANNSPRDQTNVTIADEFPHNYLNWYEPDCGMGIILLPTLNSWETLAYISFFGAEGLGETEKVMTLRDVLPTLNQRLQRGLLNSH